MRSRLLVAGLAGFLSLMHLSIAAQPPQRLPPSADQELARDIFKGLVEINTTHSQGTLRAAQAIEAWLLSAGYPRADVTILSPYEHPNSGNVILHMRAKPRAHPLPPALFLGHLDVVEAKPEDWSFDPFKLTEKDGYFYGRGTIDMKDGDAAMVESLIRLKREHYLPQRDLIVAFTADEEAGEMPTAPPSCSSRIVT